MCIFGGFAPKHYFSWLRPPKGSSLAKTASYESLRVAIGPAVTGTEGKEYKQESLANAKVSTRQLRYIGRNWLNRPHLGSPSNINVIYTSLKSTFSAQQFPRWQCGSIFIRLAVVASQTCQLVQNSEKMNLQQFKVIQGRWFWCQSKVHIRVPISD